MYKLAAAAVLLGEAALASAATCSQEGSDYTYAESVSGTKRTITTNHCPNHPNYNLNPNYAVKESTSYELPASPTFVGTATDSSTSSANIDISAKGGAVGVLFNGAMLFSPYGGPNYGTATSWSTSATYAEGNTFDQCGCHGSSTSSPSYHCHVPPSCLLRQLGQSASSHSPQVGWAFDGFPVYGPRGPGGVMMKTCTQAGGTYGTSVCTDDCGGYYLADSSIDEFVYRYYMLGDYNDGTSCALPGCASPGSEYFPNTPVCYRGCCPSGVSCHSSISDCPSSSTSDGYTTNYQASVPTINEMSVASGLPTNDGGCSCSDLACDVPCSSNGWKTQTCGAGSGWTNDCSASSNVAGATQAALAASAVLPMAGLLMMTLVA
jgi:hypothetical protein